MAAPFTPRVVRLTLPELSPGKLLQSLSSRFELRGGLGSGSMGVVYRAYDHYLGREVALKTLRAEDPNLFYSLKEEFRAAASIVHPNLVELYELFVHGAECFFTMELLEAVPFTRSVRQGGSSVPALFESPAWLGTRDPRELLTKSGTLRIGPRPDVAPHEGGSSAGAAARLAAGAAQLVTAVAALHDAGRVHCDLKPSNIVITHTGRLVVLDFGLSAPLLGQLARPGFSGTLSYAAPEQLWGGDLTVATDWYSVGVVLFEALTGELPAGESQHREVLERAMSALDAESKSQLPPRLAELLGGLLRLDPSERPSRQAIVTTLVRPRPGWSTPPPHERQFVGRASELGVLSRALLSARDGWVTAVAVHGESGMGKTELIRELALGAAQENALIVRGQCRLDESVAYQALDQVIDELSKHLALLPKTDRNTLLPDDFASLVRVFPVLARLGRPAQAADDVDAAVLRQRAVVALRQLLWRLCAWRPLVVWIDDAHWGDAESQSLLCDLLQTPAPPLLLLMSHREGAGSWLGPIAEALTQAQGQWLDVPLDPLDAGASAELVAALLGPLAEEQPLLARRVAVESGRVPLFIGQLCRLIAETTRPEDANERLTLAEVIDRRVSALATDEQRVAEMVALIEAPLPPGVVAEAAGLSPKLTSFHARVRETILLRLDPASRKRHHALLAAALERLEPGVDPEILLHHWLGADERDRALSAALRAAHAATEKLAFSHAAALYRTALGLFERSQPERRAVQEKLADALSAAGRAVEAGEHYLALAADASAPDSLRWTQRATENFLVGGSLDKGMSVLAEALRLVQLPAPPSTARAVASGLARVVMYRLSHAQPRRERNADEALRADLCLSAAKGLGVVDPMLSAYFAFSSLHSAARSGDLSRKASALCLSGSLLAFFRGRLGRWGDEWLAEAEQIASTSDDWLLRGRVSVCQGQVELNRGLWTAALARCDAATRWLERHPDTATWERNMTHVIAIRALEELGELKRAWQRAADWRSDAQSRGDLYAETTADLYLAFAALGADDADRAERIATLALRKWAAEPPPFHEYYRLRVIAHAQLYRGAPEAALATLELAEGILRSARLDTFPTSILEVGVLRARIYLRLARQEREAGRSLARCEREIERIGRLVRDDASAHASFLRAAVAAARGQRQAALELLGAARQGFAGRQMGLGLTYVAAAEHALGAGAEGSRQLGAEASLRRQGIIQPRAWLALHAPGFAEWTPAAPS
jgi:eukaryotic-like serine/threonine-protein kinase